MNTYIACIGMIVFSMLILILFTFKNFTISDSAKRGIMFSAVLIMICSSAECLGFLLDGADPVFRVPHLIVKFIELSVAPYIPIIFANAFQPHKSRLAFLIVQAVHTLIQFLSMFFGITFWVDENNVYHHCMFYDIYYVAIVVSAAFLLYSISMFGMRFQSQNKTVLVMIAVFVVAGVTCQALNESIRIVWLTVAMGAILFYIYYCTVMIQVDALTELMNRSAYERRVKSERKRVGILFFDVNDFKIINDMYGHQFGDESLIQVAKALRKAYGKYGFCYRIGGDEFCAILDKRIESMNELELDFGTIMVKKRLKESRLPTVSIGSSIFEPGKMTFQESIANADENMYEAKKKSKAGRDIAVILNDK